MNALEKWRLLRWCRKVKSENPTLLENIEDYIDETLSYWENRRELEKLIPKNIEDIAETIADEYEEYITTQGTYQEVLQELAKLLTERKNKHTQNKFDKLLLRLKEFGIKGFNYSFIYSIIDSSSKPTLAVRQRIQRLLKSSEVVKPFPITTRKYYEYNGTATEYPILAKNKNFKACQTIRKKYFFFDLPSF